MNDPQITVYGAFWCPDCHRSKQFLGEHQIPYRWVDIEEDKEGEQFVIEANAGKRRIPTITFADSSVLSSPSNADLAAKLGLKTTAERFGVELLQAQQVSHIHSRDNYHCVVMADGSEYSALAILLATGSRYRRLGVPGEEDYIGAGVHFCATCDGPFYKGRPVAVIGGGNSAAEESLFLTRFAERVSLLVRGDSLRASQVIQDNVLSHPQIDVHFNTAVEGFDGAESKLRSVRIRNSQSDETADLELPGAFVFVGMDPNTGFLEDSEVRLDSQGFVVTGHSLVHDSEPIPAFAGAEPKILETSVPGIFAAGDIRAGSTKQVASAAGEGATAALMIRDHLKTV